MGMFSNTSLKRNLTLIIMAISTVSVLLTTGAITFIGIYNLRENMKEEMAVTASIVGDRNVAVLTFGDAEKAAENLNKVFSIKPSVMVSCLYDAQGKLFVEYRNESFQRRACPEVREPVVLMGKKSLQVYRSIDSAKWGRVGSIFIESDLRDIDIYIQKQS